MAKKLTPREQEVYLLLVNGMTNVEIAQELSISLKTVEKHVSMLLLKFEVKTRTKLAVNYWKKQVY